MRKEIKDLRKEFHSLADRNTPKTVDGIQEQIQREEEKHGELQREIQALKVKLGYAEEVPQVDESQLFLPEEPPDTGDPAAPEAAEGEELTLELPVTVRRSGAVEADGPTASPDGSQGVAPSPGAAKLAAGHRWRRYAADCLAAGGVAKVAQIAQGVQVTVATASRFKSEPALQPSISRCFAQTRHRAAGSPSISGD